MSKWLTPEELEQACVGDSVQADLDLNPMAQEFGNACFYATCKSLVPRPTHHCPGQLIPGLGWDADWTACNCCESCMQRCQNNNWASITRREDQTE